MRGKSFGKSSCARSSRRLFAEPLESRMLLSGIVVNTVNDAIYPPQTGLISLRNAVTTANSAATPTTITFDPTVFATPKTIALNNVLILTNKTALTTITGPAATLTISGNKASFGVSVLEVANGAKATFNNLTVTNGGPGAATAGVLIMGGTATLNNLTATANAANGINCESGTVTLTNVTASSNGRDGIENGGTMTLTNVTVSNNKNVGFGNSFGIATATNLTATGNQGGGIGNASLNGSKNTLTITNAVVANNTASSNGGGLLNSGNAVIKNATFSGNSANKGGGIYNNAGSSSNLTLINVTISGNHATKAFTNTGLGGGIYNDGSAKLTNVTIANNTAAVSGGGIYDNNALGFVLENSVVAGNSLTGTGGSGPDFFGSVTSFGHNLIGKTDGSSNWIPQDLTGTIASPLDAKLGAPVNNGGFSSTMLPLAGSPLIDKGLNSLLPTGTTTDQRGLTRIVNGIVDIGAVEVQAPAISIVITPPANQTAVLNTSKLVTLGSFTQNGATGPFKLDINWGDGTADTILNLPAAGTIPATSHTFTKSGSLSVSEQITDAKSNKSNKATFTVAVSAALGSIAGKVFGDANGDGKIDNGEFGVGLWTVYLDLNHDGKFDTGDKSTTTDINGNWSFTGLAAGSYTVRVVPVAGIVATKPVGNVLTISLSAGQNSTGNLFGERATG